MEQGINPDISFNPGKIRITEVNPLVAVLARVRAMEKDVYGEPTVRFDLTTNGKDLSPGVLVLSTDAPTILDKIGWLASELNTLFQELIRALANVGGASQPTVVVEDHHNFDPL